MLFLFLLKKGACCSMGLSHSKFSAEEQQAILDSSPTKYTKEMWSKGGVASGVARRKNRTFKQAFQKSMQLKIASNKRIEWIKENYPELNDDDMTVQMNIVLKTAEMAWKGSYNHAKIIFDSAFEIEKNSIDDRAFEEQQVFESKINFNISNLPEGRDIEELERMAKGEILDEK